METGTLVQKDQGVEMHTSIIRPSSPPGGCNQNMSWLEGSTRRLAYVVRAQNTSECLIGKKEHLKSEKHLRRRRGGDSCLPVPASPPGGAHESARPQPELGPCGPPSPPRLSAARSAEWRRLPRLWAAPQSDPRIPAGPWQRRRRRWSSERVGAC